MRCSKGFSRIYKRGSRSVSFYTVLMTLALATLTATSTITPTETQFLDTGAISANANADTLKVPTNVTVKNTRVGETDLSWTASASPYTTGYRILRSEASNGTWSQIGQASGRSTTTYIDKTSGTKRWYYKIESVYSNWSAITSPVLAPTIAGLTFTDQFSGTGNIQNRVTDNGASTWKVLNGTVNVGNFSGLGQGAQGAGFSATGTPAMAVVKTATQEGTVYLSNLSGSEGAVLRAKDSMNYVWVGGKREGAAGDGSFEVVVVKNGVRRVINDGYVVERPMGRTGVNASITIEGDVVSARFDAVKGVPGSGTLHVAIRDAGLTIDDTEATYFGIGFTKKSVLAGFHFDAKK